MAKTIIMDHPLIQHKIGLIRKKETGTKDFRQTISEIAMLICYEATRELPLDDVAIETPICKTTVKMLKGKKLAVVPILRAGLGMVDGMLTLIPTAKIGHIGLYRDPQTLKPVEYYCKLPADCAERDVFVVDPMLATGGSCVEAIRMLKEKGCEHIHFMCILAAQTGIDAMHKAHPDVDLYIGAVDETLNDHGYIVPGLGDAGDRIFGTKQHDPSMIKENEMKKMQRALAMAGVILLVLMYLITLFCAFFDRSHSLILFKASVMCTVLVPILIWGYTVIYRLAKGKNEQELQATLKMLEKETKEHSEHNVKK